MKGWRAQQLIRELAKEEVPRAELARRNGVTPGAITQFADRHSDAIAAVKSDINSALLGLWIADKANRLAEYQRDAEALAPAADAGDAEAIRTRTALLKTVAEELGQLPARVNVNVGDTRVTYVIEGIDPGALR